MPKYKKTIAIMLIIIIPLILIFHSILWGFLGITIKQLANNNEEIDYNKKLNDITYEVPKSFKKILILIVLIITIIKHTHHVILK
ncbi:MAG: hypothetical protein VZS44_04475 [Bacilli bacterium]|nr:hypothetical protein [Bacilli bacterium]